MANRIWIELDIWADPHAKKGSKAYQTIDHDINRQRAAQLNRMLNRLVLGESDQKDRVWWNEHKVCYCFDIGGGGYVEASDRGHWFNLEYFGRP